MHNAPCPDHNRPVQPLQLFPELTAQKCFFLLEPEEQPWGVKPVAREGGAALTAHLLCVPGPGTHGKGLAATTEIVLMH